MESTNVYVETDFAASRAGASLKEVSRGKPAYPAGSMSLAALANDDDVASYWENGPLRPWWMVDLGANYLIHFVDILPRQGYYSFRFQEMEVRVGPEWKDDGDFSTWELIGLYPGVYQGGNVRVHFNSSQGVCGRFLSVQRINDYQDAVALSDVKVYVYGGNPQ
ncbi:uncharacterized protein [Palaemon carinicauda]|uniref:uncharacterized protein n=1 Tax=Palaemon carinicauda TaxID=392227 RepID=UPI0035B63FA2